MARSKGPGEVLSVVNHGRHDEVVVRGTFGPRGQLTTVEVMLKRGLFSKGDKVDVDYDHKHPYRSNLTKKP